MYRYSSAVEGGVLVFDDAVVSRCLSFFEFADDDLDEGAGLNEGVAKRSACFEEIPDDKENFVLLEG